MATAKSTTAEITEIQRRMAQIRRELHEDVRGAVEGAQSLTDWRSQVRNHPWMALGAAATLGFLIVPRRRQEPVPALVAVAPAAAAATSPASPAEPRKKRWGIIGSALGLLAPIAVRAAQNYAIQYLEQWIASQPPGASSALLGSGLFPGGPSSGAGRGPGPRSSGPSGAPGRPRDIR